ncbi:MAG: FAD:protein FMN transferase [Granulosicoccus sp.]
MSEMRLARSGTFWIGEFRAMASPCEVHVEHVSQEFAAGLIKLAMNEALRIEKTFSRYRNDNAVWEINNSRGKAVSVDKEMARMLDFSSTCHEMSDGLFDVTSGILRTAWDFNGSDQIPTAADIASLLPRVGWDKVSWISPDFILPRGMQIDLGGIGKEYAVDRSIALISAVAPKVPCLVNFGGDLHANRPPVSKPAWNVGVEAARAEGQAMLSIQLVKGALTTSGDARRFLLKDGIRYGHVLNPRTGWPEENAPAAVTVAGESCLQAGILSTLAILKGVGAERFLDEQDVKYWCQR